MLRPKAALLETKGAGRDPGATMIAPERNSAQGFSRFESSRGQAKVRILFGIAAGVSPSG